MCGMGRPSGYLSMPYQWLGAGAGAWGRAGAAARQAWGRGGGGSRGRGGQGQAIFRSESQSLSHFKKFKLSTAWIKVKLSQSPGAASDQQVLLQGNAGAYIRVFSNREAKIWR